MTKYYITKNENQQIILVEELNPTEGIFPVVLDTYPEDKEYWESKINQSIPESEIMVEEISIGEEFDEVYNLIAKPKK